MKTTRVHSDERDAFDELGDLLRRSLRVMVLSGAGVSTASGLPAYQGAAGLYEVSGIAELHDAARLPESLPEVWGFCGPRRRAISEAEPNDAHRAIATYQQRARADNRHVTLATQNVDDLHERGGSGQVAHLHGSLFATRCTSCTFRQAPDATEYVGVPRCPQCGEPLRPDVVLFGETPDPDAQWTARQAVRDCDLLLAVGTSGEVSTDAHYPRDASGLGAHLVIVDPSPFVPEIYDVHVPLRAEDALPRLLCP